MDAPNVVKFEMDAVSSDDTKVKNEAKAKKENKNTSMNTDSKVDAASKGVKVKKEKDGDDDNSKKNKRIKTENVDDYNNKGEKDTKRVKAENGDSNKRTVRAFHYPALLFQNMPKYVEVNDVHQVDKTCLADLVLVSEDDCLFAVHSLLLYAASSVLKPIIVESRTTCNENNINLQIIKLQDVIGSDLSLILQYIYEGRLDVDSEEFERLKSLIARFGLVEAHEQTGQIVQMSTKAAAPDNSFFDQLNGGGVLKTPKGGKCLLCGAEFSQFPNAKRHFEVKHQQPGDLSKLKCHLCGKQLQNRVYYENHMRKDHNIKKSDFASSSKRVKNGN